MATNYPTFQSDPTLNSVTASSGVSGSSGIFNSITGTNISATNNLYVGSNLGVGTTATTYKLDVAGTGRFTSNFEVTGTVKSTSTIFAPGIDLSSSTGYANIEIGGPSGSHIDLKRPYTDDYDIRLISDNNIEGGGHLLNAGGAILALSGSGVAVGQYSNAGYKFLVGGTTRLANTVEIGQFGTLSLYDNATQVVVQYPNKQVSFYDSTNTATRMLIDTNGEVGIGTTAPTELLTVASGSNDRVGIDVQSVTSSIYFGSNTTGAARQLEFDRSTGLFKFKGRPASGVFADNVTIDINGNVGIGTTNPTRPLQVGNESGQQIVRIAGGSSGMAGGSAVYLGAGTDTLFALGHYSAIIGGAYNDTFTLYAASGRNTVFSGGGNVGIGTSTPTYKLDVAGTGRFTSNVEITGTLNGITQLTASNISSSGNISLGGNITLSNAGGIVFGSSYAGPTGSSTTLNDYEIGTWTPALSSSTIFTSTAPAATTRGTYVKIGKKVFVQCTINLTSTGSATGPVWLVGLPFGCHGYQSGIISPTSWYGMNASLNTLFVGYLLSFSTTAQLIKATAGGITGVQTTDFTNTAQLHFNGSYEVS